MRMLRIKMLRWIAVAVVRTIQLSLASLTKTMAIGDTLSAVLPLHPFKAPTTMMKITTTEVMAVEKGGGGEEEGTEGHPMKKTKLVSVE